VIVGGLELSPAELHAQTGWELKAEGACRDDVCVPMHGLAVADGKVDVADFARRMGMPLAHDDKHALWALGPRSGGRMLESAQFPPLVLQDWAGNDFDLAGLRGRKVMLLAWATY